MDGWMDEWIDKWMNGRTNEWNKLMVDKLKIQKTHTCTVGNIEFLLRLLV